MPGEQPTNYFIEQHRKAIEAVAAHISTLWAPVSIFGEPDATVGRCLGCFESGQIFVIESINNTLMIDGMQTDGFDSAGGLVAWLPFPAPFVASSWRWGTNVN